MVMNNIGTIIRSDNLSSPFFFFVAENPDTDKDVRAMAIKLFGVAGSGPTALNPNELGYENNTQDFILLSSDIFFTNELASYPALMKVPYPSFPILFPCSIYNFCMHLY